MTIHTGRQQQHGSTGRDAALLLAAALISSVALGHVGNVANERAGLQENVEVAGFFH